MRDVTTKINLLPALGLLVLGLLIHGFAQASNEIIGDGVQSARERDYPALCRIVIEGSGWDRPGNCSGTLVGPTEIDTAAHCFKKGFKLRSASVRVTCGNRNATVVDVEMPESSYWLDDNRPSTGFDFARLTLKKPLTDSMPRSQDSTVYFRDDGHLQSDVRCWMAGYGNTISGNPEEPWFGQLSIVELPADDLIYSGGTIQLRPSKGGKLRFSADQGDSGGSLYCSAHGQDESLVGVIVSYTHADNDDGARLQNFFAPIWVQPF